MAEKILVEAYVRDAQQFLSILDHERRGIVSCFWFFSDAHERWRLLIASPIFDQMMQDITGHTNIYRLLARDIHDVELERMRLGDVQVEPTFHKLVRAVADDYHIVTQKPVWLEGYAYNSSYVDGLVILRSNLSVEKVHG